MIPGNANPLLLPIAAGGGALVIGQSFQGGYYAGTITYGTESWLGIGGEQYHLIMAPKSSGEASTIKQYKTSATCDGAESNQTSAQSVWDGYHNTYTSVIGSSSAHPAANYCQGLSIGGYSDWYLAANQESSLAFGNLRQLAAWQAGGAEEFTTGTVILNGSSVSGLSAYWNSTGDSCENTGTVGTASIYYQSGGYLISGYAKTDQFFVRAIRRVAV
jgi:hypothetical protein